MAPMDKMGLPAGSAAQFGQTGADHDPNSIHHSMQTDQNGLFASPVWVGLLEMPLDLSSLASNFYFCPQFLVFLGFRN
jgi:hypothetical protein